jgi:uncharacterized protein YdeI (YjbR/CyaY-like superfamily)
MQLNEIDTFYATSKEHWRLWLQENHKTKKFIWLIQYKKKTNIPSITWSDAVDEALCYGWIDSVAKPIDDEKFVQYFCPRKPNSTWSKVNKEKIKLLIEANLMAEAGYLCIEKAKENGYWSILDEVEELIIPIDLEDALLSKNHAMDYFLSLSKSTRKAMLQWLVLAKQPTTRQKRIDEIAELASIKKKPKQF